MYESEVDALCKEMATVPKLESGIAALRELQTSGALDDYDLKTIRSPDGSLYDVIAFDAGYVVYLASFDVSPLPPPVVTLH